MEAARECDPDVQCNGKERFSSPQVAAKSARRRNASKKHRGTLTKPLVSYRCPHCRMFHVGGAS